MNNKDRKDLKQQIEAVNEDLKKLESYLWSLKYQCLPHNYIKRENSFRAVCDTCGSLGGWYCPDSEDNICHYDEDENCIYCGNPEEIK